MLGRFGRRLLAVAEPAGVDAREGDALTRAEERAARRMDFSLTPDGDGGAWLRGRLDPAGAAVVRAALDPLARPGRRPRTGPTREHPAGARGRAGRALPGGLAPGDLPDTGGEPRKSWSPSRCASLRDGMGAGSSTTAPPSPPAWPAGWPATRRHPRGPRRPQPRSSTWAGPAAVHRRRPPRPRPARRRLRLPRLRPAGRLVRRPPHHRLGGRRRHHHRQRGTALRAPSPDGRTRHWHVTRRRRLPEFLPPPWTDPDGDPSATTCTAASERARQRIPRPNRPGRPPVHPLGQRPAEGHPVPRRDRLTFSGAGCCSADRWRGVPLLEPPGRAPRPVPGSTSTASLLRRSGGERREHRKHSRTWALAGCPRPRRCPRVLVTDTAPTARAAAPRSCIARCLSQASSARPGPERPTRIRGAGSCHQASPVT